MAARIQINHLKINQRLDVVQQAGTAAWADAVLASEHMVVAHLGVAVVVGYGSLPLLLDAFEIGMARTFAACEKMGQAIHRRLFAADRRQVPEIGCVGDDRRGPEAPQ